MIHCNDWNTGLIPVYRDTHYQGDHYFGRTACVFTTHNAGGDAFQGGFSDPHGLLQLAGLTAANVFTIGATKSLHHYNKFNFSKGGLGFADIINTVSLKYRRELMTRAFSGGLEGLFQQRANDFAGVLNGIDTIEWSPSSDTHLQDRAFSATDPVSTIQAAKRSVRDLLRQWVVPAGTKSTRLRSGDSPFALLRGDTRLIGVVSRIDSQKMPLLL